MHIAPNEKRTSQRKRRTGAVAWRFLGWHDSQVGMLIETSEDGLAFAWRGAVRPQVGAIIELLEDTAGGTAKAERAVVRRALKCHEDLNLIAVQIINMRPFPPQSRAAAAVSARTFDLTPVVCQRFLTSARLDARG